LISFTAIVLLGFFLGMKHALDPDHVVAITTIVTRQGQAVRAALIGAMWGLGHTLTIFLVGSAIILLHVAIPARLGLAMELAVGGMLILLGVLNITGVLKKAQDRFTAEHDDTKPHRHGLMHAFASLGMYNVVRPLAIGIVHGLAGSAAVALLVMTTIKEPWWQLGYLLLFGIGTIAGMTLITTVLAKPVTHGAKRFSGLSSKLAFASGLLSLLFGLYVSYNIGFVDGLFTNHPNWTPQ
jgi:high-affinity nickel-transport protein